MKRLETLLTAAVLIFSAQLISAQTGGNYAFTQSVVASGGGQQTAGGSFALDGTIGQSLAGTLSTAASGAGNQYAVRGGFWATEALAPTAANVSVSGRVKIGKRGIIRRVRIILTDAFTGITRSTLTDQFGSYRFEELEAGHFYILEATSKNFVFTPASHSFPLLENLEEVNFIGARKL